MRKNQNSSQVRICPGASSFAELTTNCEGGENLYEGVSGQYTVSIEEIEDKTYWKIAGVTGTGAFNIINDFDVSDLLSRLEKSQDSSHEISFGTINGLKEGGETIEIAFPQEFDISNIAIDDIDLLDDGVDLDLCLGDKVCLPNETQWGVEIDLISNSIIFTSPNVSGYILGGSIIAVKIGDNAEYQSFGENFIINPSFVAEYEISMRIENIVVETGEVSIPILDDDNVSIRGYLDTVLTFDIDTTTQTGNIVGGGDCDSSEGINPCDSYPGSNDALGYVVSVGEMTTNTVNKSGQTFVNHAAG